MLDKRPKRRGNKARAREQQKELSIMAKVSKSAKARLRKRNTAKPKG